MREFDFDTIMYPVNFVCHYRSGFDVEVLAEAKKRGMGIIALKAMARQKWPSKTLRKSYPKCWYQPIDGSAEARLALSWSMAQGTTAALPPGEERLYRLALDVAPKCRVPTSSQTNKLKKLAASLTPI